MTGFGRSETQAGAVRVVVDVLLVACQDQAVEPAFGALTVQYGDDVVDAEHESVPRCSSVAQRGLRDPDTKEWSACAVTVDRDHLLVSPTCPGKHQSLTLRRIEVLEVGEGTCRGGTSQFSG